MKQANQGSSFPPPDPQDFETVGCLLCSSSENKPLIKAQDDLTGKPGWFQFVTCTGCGFAYQNPRLRADKIGTYYDDEYIAHRKKQDWGLFAPLYEWAMGKHDRDKLSIVQDYVSLSEQSRSARRWLRRRDFSGACGGGNRCASNRCGF